MLTIDQRSIRQPDLYQPHAHHCEAVAVYPNGQSQYLNLTWLGRTLVPSTFVAVEWLFDWLVKIVCQLDGPVQEKAALWLDNAESQRNTYSKLYSGEGFNFNAPDEDGTVYLLSVSPECRSTPPRKYDPSHEPPQRRGIDGAVLRPRTLNAGWARSGPVDHGGLHALQNGGLHAPVQPRP
ncbi:hypothetical protein ABZ714_12900 [Streptomyces sp. NPDC006798]|uniref:hypothetical protein n=1 Tax=Streptomyces sp. NPDC006798 TaxID=3155462 RepID=UPI0033C45331